MLKYTYILKHIQKFTNFTTVYWFVCLRNTSFEKKKNPL